MSRLRERNDCASYLKEKDLGIKKEANRMVYGLENFKTTSAASNKLYKYEYHVSERLNRKETIETLLEVAKSLDDKEILVVCKDARDKEHFRKSRKLKDSDLKFTTENLR